VRYLNINGQSYTNTYTYNDGDHVTTIAYPNSGPVITNAYFTSGTLKQVSRVGGSAFYTISAGGYDEFGHATNYLYGNGVTTSRGYYSVSKRLQNISAVSGSSIFSRTFTYSNSADIASISGTGLTNTMSMTYDNLHRIKSYTGTGGLSAITATMPSAPSPTISRAAGLVTVTASGGHRPSRAPSATLTFTICAAT